MTEPYTDTVGNPAPTAYATTPSTLARGCGKRTCRHPDRHQCPWLNEDRDGHAVPCGCTHQPAAKGRKK